MLLVPIENPSRFVARAIPANRELANHCVLAGGAYADERASPIRDYRWLNNSELDYAWSVASAAAQSAPRGFPVPVARV